MARTVDHVVCARLSDAQWAQFEALKEGIGTKAQSEVIRWLLSTEQARELAYTVTAQRLAEAHSDDRDGPGTPEQLAG